MAFWLELHCDILDGGDNKYGSPACYTEAADSPGLLVNSQNKHVLQGINVLRERARKAGWKLTKDGWICPVCLTRRAPR